MADPMDILKLGQQNFQAVLGMQENNMAKTIGLMQTGNQLEMQAASALFQAADTQRFHTAQIEGIKTENAIRGVQAQAQLDAMQMQRDMMPLKLEEAKINLERAKTGFAYDSFSKATAISDQDIASLYAGNLNNNIVSEYSLLKEDTFNQINKNPAASGVVMEDFNRKKRDIMEKYKGQNPNAYNTYDPTTSVNLQKLGLAQNASIYERNNPAIVPDLVNIKLAMSSRNPQVRNKAMSDWGHHLTPEQNLQANAIGTSGEGLDSYISSLKFQIKENGDREDMIMKQMGQYEEGTTERNGFKEQLAKIHSQNALYNNMIVTKQDEWQNRQNTFASGKPETEEVKNQVTPEDKKYLDFLNNSRSETPADAEMFHGPKSDLAFQSKVTELDSVFQDTRVLSGYNPEYVRQIRDANKEDPDKEKVYVAKHLQSEIETFLDNPTNYNNVRANISRASLQRHLDTLSENQFIRVFKNPDETDLKSEAHVGAGEGGAGAYEDKFANTQVIRKGAKVEDILGASSGDKKEERQKIIRAYAKILAAKSVDTFYNK